jgi:hypothetical protein
MHIQHGMRPAAWPCRFAPVQEDKLKAARAQTMSSAVDKACVEVCSFFFLAFRWSGTWLDVGCMRCLCRRPRARSRSTVSNSAGLDCPHHIVGACRLHVFYLALIEENFNPINSTIFVLFGKYCLIMDQLGSKDSSRDFQLNYVISYFLYLHLILHTSG